MSEINVCVDLRASFGSIRNQGARPTCLAFAASDVHAAVRDGWTPLSCEYVFYHAQRRAGRTPDVGALLSSMIETLRDDGQPEEQGWPYLTNTPPDTMLWVPPGKMDKLYGRNGTPLTHSIDLVIKQLDQGWPVIILTMLSRSFYHQSIKGVIDPSADEQPEPARRHAVIAVGHGKVGEQRAVLVRNSWGPSWGDAGYGWLTERFLGPRIYAAAMLLEDVDVSSHSVAA